MRNKAIFPAFPKRFADLIVLAAVFLFYDHRQTQCALAGVVSHGIAHKAKPHLISDLLHNGSLAQTWCTSGSR